MAIKRKVLKAIRVEGGGNIGCGVDPKTGNYHHLYWGQGEVKELTDRLEIEAIERSGMLGLELIELDENNKPIKQLNGKVIEKVVELVKAGVVSAKLSLPELAGLQPKEIEDSDSEASESEEE